MTTHKLITTVQIEISDDISLAEVIERAAFMNNHQSGIKAMLEECWLNGDFETPIVKSVSTTVVGALNLNTITLTKKPAQTLESQARDLLQSAEEMVKFNFDVEPDQANTHYEDLVRAVVFGSLFNSPNREVQYQALRIRFGYTDDQIATQIIGG